MIGKLGHQYMGQQTGGGDALVDDVRIHRGLDQGLAIGTRLFAVHMALDTEDTRQVVQLLGDIFTVAFHLTAATAGSGVGFVVDLDAWQVGWQRLAFGLTLDPYRLIVRGELFDIVAHRLLALIKRLVEQAFLLSAEALALRGKLQALGIMPLPENGESLRI